MSEEHIRRVHDGFLYLCEECNYTTSNKQILDSHVKAVHKGIHYSCDECEFTLSWKLNLVRHKRDIHNNAGEFPCDQCDHKACKKRYLEDHITCIRNKHGRRESPCHQCDYKARQKRSLAWHKKYRHGKNELLPCE